MLLNWARTLFLIAAYICCFNNVNAQNFTTKGVEFWTAYGAHTSMFKKDGSVINNGGTQKMIFYLLCNKPTTVKVEIPAIGWVHEYEVSAGKTTVTDEMPKVGADDVRLVDEGVFNKGIHITSPDLITVYCHILDDKSSATSLLLPINICGQEYYNLGYKQESLNPNGRSYCFVVATEDSTEIEVTPSVKTLNHPAGVPFTQILNKGEVLNLFGAPIGLKDSVYKGSDLSGTYIRTLIQGNNDICKKIVVFSGSTAASIVCKANASYTSDNLFQQVPCIDNWGRAFIAVPTLFMETNRYRVIVANPSQKVYLNGRQLTNIINNRYYDFKANKASTIRSDSLIAVAQFITSAGQCGSTAGDKAGDPEMIFLSPNGTGITSTLINSTKRKDIQAHFINVVMKTNDVDSFKLDGYTMPQVFKVYDRNPNYSIAQIPVTQGRHILECDSGFSTYAYGYGKLESYGYNGGYSTKHINGRLGVSNTYKSLYSTTTACTDNPFRLYFDVEEKLLNLECTFYNNSHLTPNKDVALRHLQPDSSYYVDSISTTFYRYYLPGVYRYSTAEQLPVQLTGYFPDRQGCIEKKQFNFLIDVIQKPTAGIAAIYDSCANNIITFNDNSQSFGNSQLIRWRWDFNDGITAAQQNTQHQYDNFGEYNVEHRVINDVGCYADTTKKIGLYHHPVASFVVSGINCNKQDILFKSTSTVVGDELADCKWNFSDRTIALAPSLIRQFADSGNYDVKLIAKTTHGCTDTATQHLQIFQTPEINLPPILYIPIGDTLRLKPTYKGSIQSYSWSPSTYLSSTVSPDPIASAMVDITYSVTAIGTQGACKAIASTDIKIQNQLNIPSAFTPNGDGLNDTWRIFNIEDYGNCTIEVYNRWGNRVFYSRGYATPWNGTMNGQPVPAGTYLYMIQLSRNQKIIVQKGTVTIIR